MLELWHSRVSLLLLNGKGRADLFSFRSVSRAAWLLYAAGLTVLRHAWSWYLPQFDCVAPENMQDMWSVWSGLFFSDRDVAFHGFSLTNLWKFALSKSLPKDVPDLRFKCPNFSSDFCPQDPSHATPHQQLCCSPSLSMEYVLVQTFQRLKACLLCTIWFRNHFNAIALKHQQMLKPEIKN